MKIIYHMGNIHFQDFGGKNFVLPDKAEGEKVLSTLQAAIAAQQGARADGAKCLICGEIVLLSCSHHNGIAISPPRR